MTIPALAAVLAASFTAGNSEIVVPQKPNAAVAFAALMVAVFVICRTLSKNERNIARIAQRLALLEERLREAEGRAGKTEPPRG